MTFTLRNHSSQRSTHASTRMRRPSRAPIATLAILCMAAAGAWGDKAFDILEKSIRAEGNVTFSGAVEIRKHPGSRPPHTQKLIKASRNRSRVEVTGPRSEAGRLIISDGSTEWEYRPKENLARKWDVPPLAEIQRHKLEALRLVRSTLHATYVGTGSIAGRKCHIIAVKPPSGKTTRKKVWIDTKKLVELKSERYTPQGQLANSWTVTTVDFAPTIRAGVFDFDPPKGCKIRRILRAQRIALSEAQKKVGFKAIIPSYLPPGFAFNKGQVGVVGLGRQDRPPALWMEFIDGVDRFSIYQSKPMRPVPGAVKRAFYWEAKGYSFVLIGPLAQDQKNNIKTSTQN